MQLLSAWATVDCTELLGLHLEGPAICSYLGGDKHGDAEGDGGEEHEEGGEEGRVGAELGPLGLHDQAVPVRRCRGKGIGNCTHGILYLQLYDSPMATMAMEDMKRGTPWQEWASWHSHSVSSSNGHLWLQ